MVDEEGDDALTNGYPPEFSGISARLRRFFVVVAAVEVTLVLFGVWEGANELAEKKRANELDIEWCH